MWDYTFVIMVWNSIIDDKPIIIHATTKTEAKKRASIIRFTCQPYATGIMNSMACLPDTHAEYVNDYL